VCMCVCVCVCMCVCMCVCCECTCVYVVCVCVWRMCISVLVCMFVCCDRDVLQCSFNCGDRCAEVKCCLHRDENWGSFRPYCFKICDAYASRLRHLQCGSVNLQRLSIEAASFAMWFCKSATLEHRGCVICRVGQNRIYTPYMTVYMVNSLPKLPYTHRIYMVLANPSHLQCGSVSILPVCLLQRSEPHIAARPNSHFLPLLTHIFHPSLFFTGFLRKQVFK
jgi:hypothetical protein